MADQMAEVSVELLTELLNIRKQHIKVCNLFKVDPEEISKDYIGDGIVERIRQYVTSYTMRKSLSETENGQAFREPIPTPLQDIEKPTT